MTDDEIDTDFFLRLELLKKRKKKEIGKFHKIANVSCFAHYTSGQVFCEEPPGNICIDVNRKEFSFHESLDSQ